MDTLLRGFIPSTPSSAKSWKTEFADEVPGWKEREAFIRKLLPPVAAFLHL